MSQPRAVAKTEAETMLGLQFSALASKDLDRVAAFEAFAKTGLPTRRNESWHYSDLRAAMKTAAPLARKPDAERIAAAREKLAGRERIGGARFVLVDGYFVEELSDPAPSGMQRAVFFRVGRWERPDPLLLLNDAFSTNGLLVFVKAGVEIDKPVEIVHYAGAEGPHALYSQVSATVEAGARISFLETFCGASGDCQRNAAAQISIGAHARCEYVSVVDDHPELHIESQVVSLGEDAEFNAFALIAAGALVRRQIFANHWKPGVKINLSGLTLLDGARRADTTIEIRHEAPKGTSREFFRSIVADEAVGTFQGKVIVAPGAQKTDGAMKSQAILLSPTAAMNNKPELEIFADDVACGHGATVGALDADELFYLQTRGIPRDEAEAMLLEAFGAEAIERIGSAEIAAAIASRAKKWLEMRSARR